MAAESFTSMVVDDDRLTRRVVADALASAGHSVTTAGDALEALGLLRERPVDLVITDWQMPEMDGLELTSKLRSLPDGGPGVILITGAGTSVAPSALEAGCDDFLVKPVNQDELGLRAARVIEERRRKRELVRERRRTDRERLARRDAENVTEQTMQRLRDLLSEQRELNGLYESLLASAGSGIFGIDLDGRATFVNDAACQALGYRREDLIGADVHSLIHHSRPEGSHYPLEECPISIAACAGQAYQVDDEIFFRNDGASFPVSYRATPIRVEGHITGAVVIFDDNTDRELTADRIRGQNERLVEQQAELEAQNEQLQEQGAELEAQNDQLHEQQARLEERADLLSEQRAEVQRLYDQAAGENARLENLYGAARALAIRIEDPQELSDTMLARLIQSADAAVGALYLRRENHGPLLLAATAGLDHDELAGELTPAAGLAGRALAERGVVAAAHSAGDLRLVAFGQEIALRRELHIPLQIGDEIFGVASFGWSDEDAVDENARRALEALVAQAAAGLSRAISERATYEREAVIRAVLDATPDSIRLEDPAGRVQVANAAARSFYRNVIGVDITEESADRLRDALAERTTRPEDLRRADRIEGRRAASEFELANNQRCFRRYTAPVRDEAGNSLGRIVVTREVTEERRAERIKDEIVATVSHELRTPLTSIIGYAELLDEELSERLDDDEQHMLRVVDRNARRLLALVGDLLVAAQAGAHELDIVEQDCDIAAVAAACVEDARPTAVERTIALNFQAPEPAILLGDADRLGQAVSNLLGNALKFTPKGGSVNVRVTTVEGFATLEVEDDGPGIEEDEIAKLFDRFYRGESAAAVETPGSGLGLAVTKAVVDAHGGNVEVDSVLGRGTRMIVTLPLKTTVEPRGGSGS